MKSKDIKIRELVDDDIAEVSEWFVRHKWPIAPSKSLLPDLAYIAEIDDTPLAVIWVYLTNSSIFWFEWVATNPDFQVKGLISLKKLSSALLKIVPQTQRIEWHGVRGLVEYAFNEVESGKITPQMYEELLLLSKRYVESFKDKEPQYMVGHLATPNAKLARQFEKIGFKNTEVAHLLWHNLSKGKEA